MEAVAAQQSLDFADVAEIHGLSPPVGALPYDRFL